MRCTTTFNKVLSKRGILLLMLWISSGNMSAGLANIDGTASITCNFIYHMGFQILIKRWFQGGQASSKLSCCENDLNITQFFQSTCKILRDISSVLNKKNLGLGSLLLRLLTFKMLFILGWFFCDLFLRDYFIQRLINNTGGPLRWVLIFSPDLLTFLKSYIKGSPVIGRIKNPKHSPLKHISLLF